MPWSSWSHFTNDVDVDEAKSADAFSERLWEWFNRDPSFRALIAHLPPNTLLRAHLQEGALHLVAIPRPPLAIVETGEGEVADTPMVGKAGVVWYIEGHPRSPHRVRRLVLFDLVPEWSYLLQARYALDPQDYRFLQGL